MPILILTALSLFAAGAPLPKDNGYRGIWYYNQPTKDQYVYKYSGGFATYRDQQSPIAYYSKIANKTFFCYGGTVKGKQECAHDNPVMTLDTAAWPPPSTIIPTRRASTGAPTSTTWRRAIWAKPGRPSTRSPCQRRCAR